MIKFERDDNEQYVTDIEIDFKNTNLLKFIHNKQTIATYDMKWDKLTIKQASENYLVDEKLFDIIKQALLMYGDKNETDIPRKPIIANTQYIDFPEWTHKVCPACYSPDIYKECGVEEEPLERCFNCNQLLDWNDYEVQH